MRNNLISGGTAAATGVTGLAEMTAKIPNDIGKIACLVGICASLTVIVVQIIKSFYDSKRAELEIKKLKIDIKKELKG